MKVWTDCEHLIHTQCFEDHIRRKLNCPACSKPLDINLIMKERDRFQPKDDFFDGI